MERGPLIRILEHMRGTELELDLIINSRNEPLEIRNVTMVTELHSANGIQITTRQNQIWVDASHVAAAYQARDDGS
jgi:pectate lyase